MQFAQSKFSVDFMVPQVSQNPKLSTNDEVFSAVTAKTGFQFLFQGQTSPPCVSFNKNNLDSMLWEELNDTTFKALKESLMNPAALEHPNDHIPFPLFFFFKMKREEVPLGCSSRKMETPLIHSVVSSAAGPSGARVRTMPQGHWGHSPSVKATEKTAVGSPVSFLLLVQKDLSWIFITSTFSSQPSHRLWSPPVNRASRNSLTF